MAEVPRSRLPSGYDEVFVNAVEDENLCLICHLPLKEPVQTRCGHRFCKECLEEHFRRYGFVYLVLRHKQQWLFVRHPFGDLHLLFIRESEDFIAKYNNLDKQESAITGKFSEIF